MTKKPLDVLEMVLNQNPVIISLKGGREIHGIIQGYDIHMNLVIDSAEELKMNELIKIGTLIIRGENVIYISKL